MFYYRGTKIYAVRKGPYKAHFFTKSAYGKDKEKRHDPPLLYHLGHDPSEKYDVAADHPDVIKDIQKEVALHLANLRPGEDRLAKRIEE
jgi:arylsulfatase A-like enzyme